MTARSRDERPSSWEEIVASLWQALNEVRPVTRELAERKAELTPFGDVPPPDAVHDTNGGAAPFPEADAPRPPVAPSLEPAARLLSRELVLGRVVLLIGIAAFVGALAFALHVVVSAPEPPSATGGPVAAAPGAAVPPAGAARGRLLVALVPDGTLEDVTDLSGRRVVGPEPLPADLTLPAGKYRARLAHRASGCSMTVTFEVRPGGTTRVLESCLPGD
jgi:hypothetical protein